MGNIRQHYGKSGCPHLREVREGREMSGKKGVPHVHTNLNGIHVRRKNITVIKLKGEFYYYF